VTMDNPVKRVNVVHLDILVHKVKRETLVLLEHPVPLDLKEIMDNLALLVYKVKRVYQVLRDLRVVLVHLAHPVPPDHLAILSQ
jgi:hypothetical protein